MVWQHNLPLELASAWTIRQVLVQTTQLTLSLAVERITYGVNKKQEKGKYRIWISLGREGLLKISNISVTASDYTTYVVGGAVDVDAVVVAMPVASSFVVVASSTFGFDKLSSR
jgi:hypothetical protein